MATRVIVALDGSEIAEQALDPAEAFAQVIGVPMHLVRVVDLLPIERVDSYALGLLGPSPEGLIQDEQAAAQTYLQQVQRRLAGRGISVTTEVRIGLVTQGILDSAGPADLIAIASHGRSGVTRWLIGSVAEEIMRRSPVPVLLVRVSGDPKDPQENSRE